MKQKINEADRELYQQGVGLRFDAQEENFKKLFRKMDVMQKTLDLLFADRAILEDIVTSLGGLKSMNVLNREHTENVLKSVQEDVNATKTTVQEVHADVKETKTTVEEGLTDIGDSMDKATTQQKNTVILKDQTLIDKVKKTVGIT